jgi:LmbE family N-acetylglucosaminyl deacetylase
VFQQAAEWKADAPAALYHLAVPQSVAQALGLAHLHALPDDQITLAVDVTAVWEQKMAAIHCHRTQAGSTPILRAPAERQRLFLGTEHFRRVQAREEHDVFESTLSGSEGDGL